MEVMVTRLKKTLDDDVFMPMYPLNVLDNRLSGPAIFFHRQSWSCIKILSTQPKAWIASLEGDSTLQQLENMFRYLVSAAKTLHQTTTLERDVERLEGSPQQGDLRLSGPPSGQGAGSGARTRDRRVPADLRADSQATVLPTPPEDF
ncbi:Gc-rich sequence DNA-binding factor 1 [Plakobranchus ocellatus]|uniref:Gc-rich sequence DNA-binding factor 1 n=1 Tax=Plakobranchus ocellatus TaxID=259542 RepID=A0AAV4AV76_9GAST|nr:Gc-rich sequence DNA-binding factor 1 [Plakobranchus ocellatus]